MHELVIMMVIAAFGGVAAIGAGVTMMRGATRRELVVDLLPPARANGLPVLPRRSPLGRVLVLLVGLATLGLGAICACIAFVIGVGVLLWLPAIAKLVLAAATVGGVVIAWRAQRRIRQPA